MNFFIYKTKLKKDLNDHPNNRINNAVVSLDEHYKEHKRGIKVEDDLASLKSYYNRLQIKNSELIDEYTKKNSEEIDHINLRLSSQIGNSRMKSVDDNNNFAQHPNSYANTLEKEMNFDNINFNNHENNNYNNNNKNPNNQHYNPNVVSTISDIKNNFNNMGNESEIIYSFNNAEGNNNYSNSKYNYNDKNFQIEGTQFKKYSNPYINNNANSNTNINSKRKFEIKKDEDNFSVNQVLNRNLNRLRDLDDMSN